MRRASRGRLVRPVSCNDVEGKEGFIGAAAVDVPFGCDCCEGCDCVLGAVGGLAFGAPEAEAVVGGVEMPFGMFSAAGEAMAAVAQCVRSGKVRGRGSRSSRARARTRMPEVLAHSHVKEYKLRLHHNERIKRQ
jgi:hypothetical protein